jgi:phage major head subunit gpT-like protein
MAVTPAEVSAFLTEGLKVVFEEAYAAQAPQWARIAMRVDSNKESEDYAWLGATPGLREFRDERVIRGLGAYDFAIKNRTWEATIGIKRSAIEDDQYGQLKMRVSQMASEAGRHMDSLVFGLLAGGFSGAGYDGRPFFDAAHNEGDGGNQGNLGLEALSAQALKTALTTMRRIKDDKGRPMSVTPNVLVVPPELEWTAREILESAYWPDALPGADGSQKLASNVLQNSLLLLVSPELPDADNWFLLDTTKPVRPLIAQVRLEPEFTSLEADSETGFLRDEYLYGVRARHSAGYGLWQYAFGAQV